MSVLTITLRFKVNTKAQNMLCVLRVGLGNTGEELEILKKKVSSLILPLTAKCLLLIVLSLYSTSYLICKMGIMTLIYLKKFGRT